MSDVAPFRQPSPEVAHKQSETPEVFTPDLEGFDFARYEAREEALLGVAGNSDDTRGMIADFQDQDPAVGVMLDNLHNREITGKPVRGLQARLAVLSGSVIHLGLPELNFRAGVAAETGFEAADLRGADFTDSVMPLSSFVGCDLSGASFVSAVINGADFTNAKLVGADMTGAYLVNPTGLTEAQLRGVKLDGVRVVVAPDQGDAKKSIEAALSGYFGKLATSSELLSKTDPVPIALEGTVVPPLQANRSFEGLYGQKLALRGVDFTASRLIGLTLVEVVAPGIVLRGSRVSGAVVSKSNLNNADLHSAWAPGSIWESVSMRDADFTGANLVGSIFRGVDLTGAKGLSAHNTNLEGVIFESCTLPDGSSYDGFSLQFDEPAKTPELPDVGQEG
jgi:uncharacterized protein YjbI with pentapeptide repeats